MFSDNKTTSGAKRCSQKRGIIPAAPTFRPTPVIPRRKSFGECKGNFKPHSQSHTSLRGTTWQSYRLRVSTISLETI